MRRFFVDKIVGESYTLIGDEHHHLASVLRMKEGDEVVLCPNDGKDYFATIKKIDKTSTTLKITSSRECAQEPKVIVDLFVGALKNDKLDLVVMKAVELGASSVNIVDTRYVQESSKHFRLERLQKISLEASKQCGRARTTPVNPLMTFAEAVDQFSAYDAVVFPYENGGESVKKYLAGLSGGKIAILIGSEGGFCEEEVSLLVAKGIVPLTLGNRILRAETACISTLSLVMYELGELC